MVTIRLLGEAGRRFGRQFKLAVKTPAEAVRALCVQIPALRQYLLDSSDNGIMWRVITDQAEGLEENQLLWPMSKRLVLAPIPAGRGAVGKILVGVALVIASVAIVFGTVGGGTPLALAGLSFIFGGVADLLTPTPKMPTTEGRSFEEQKKSFTFDKSNANTQQGEVVPVLYGERIIGSLAVLSFGLELQNSL